MSNKRWYPDQSTFGSYGAWDAHKKALDMIYDLKAQVESLGVQTGSNAKTGVQNQTGPPKSGPGSFKETYLAGILVKPTVPQNGQALKYNSTSGQWEPS